MSILRNKLFITVGSGFLLISGALFFYNAIPGKGEKIIFPASELPKKNQASYRKIDNEVSEIDSRLNINNSPLEINAKSPTPISLASSGLLKPIKIGGGGFVTGIVIHPQLQDLIYARTDVGGLYRWNSVTQSWSQLLSQKSVGQKVSLAIESVAIDSNNPHIIYAATGTFTHKKLGNILKSTDYGLSLIHI